jgi:hypothetical protein
MNKNYKVKYKINKNMLHMNECINIKFWNFKLNDKHQHVKNEKRIIKNIFSMKELKFNIDCIDFT